MSAQDFNPYVYGVKPMTYAEASRHVKAIVNDLNQGKEILSRQAAFLLGLSVNEFLKHFWRNNLKHVRARKEYGRVNIYNKQSMLNAFATYKARSYREHFYIGKRIDSKQAKALLQLAYDSLTA